MTSFISAILRGLNRTATTANGALSNESTLDAVLDFFSKAGSLRSDSEQAVSYFEKAFHEDEPLAMKALFYIRDIRGGQGERDTFRDICDWLAMNYPEAIIRNIPYIPTYGRWDDLYTLVNNERTRNQALAFMKKQFDEDMAATSNVSLLGKWLKSENASSPESKRLGAITRKAFGLSSRNYRKALTALRAKINIVETHMSESKWDDIEYSAVPSCAMKIYRKAFNKHDAERYTEYLRSVARGETKINASTLYPYDLVRIAMEEKDPVALESIDAQWKALPNYIEDAADSQAMVIADVSGSMYSSSNPRPIDVAISLAIYFAERMKGPFGGYFMTFTDVPDMVRVRGDTLQEKVNDMSHASWGMNTDLIAAFKTILLFATRHKVPADQMPKKLFIISDMQFDRACKNNDATNFEVIDDMYQKAGYKRPLLVFWNVNGVHADSPVTKDDTDTYLISGCSPSILKYALNSKALTPIDLMLEVLNSERYADIH